jgi:NADH-quinone oxidoreductase subunit J
MWEQEVAFWIIAVAMVGAAIGVVRSNNVVHAALFLVVVLAGSAAQYILLVAEFVAWVQVLIYIGAIVVLFLFGVLVVFLVDAFGNDKIKFDDSLVHVGSTQNVGNEIFRNYVIPFEVVSMLLLAALVGAVVMARRD